MNASENGGQDPAVKLILARCIAARTKVRLRPGFSPCAVRYLNQRYSERPLLEVPKVDLQPLFSGVEVSELLTLDEPILTKGSIGWVEAWEILRLNLPHPLAHLAFAIWRFERVPE